MALNGVEVVIIDVVLSTLTATSVSSISYERLNLSTGVAKSTHLSRTLVDSVPMVLILLEGVSPLVALLDRLITLDSVAPRLAEL